jgi:hypothetical protein
MTSDFSLLFPLSWILREPSRLYDTVYSRKDKWPVTDIPPQSLLAVGTLMVDRARQTHSTGLSDCVRDEYFTFEKKQTRTEDRVDGPDDSHTSRNTIEICNCM